MYHEEVDRHRKLICDDVKKRMNIIVEPWQTFYFKRKYGNIIYKCDILGIYRIDECEPNKVLHKVESFDFIITLPDAALNRLSKVTGYDYLSRGYIKMIPYGIYPNRVPVHIYKNSEYLYDAENGLGRCHENKETDQYEYGPKNPWLPKVSIEYISGIGLPLSAGFADIVVLTIDI